MKIAIIGGGNMGEAMLAAVLKRKLSAPETLCVGDVREERRNYLKGKYGVAVTGNNKEAIAAKDVIVLAVKPQNMADAMKGLHGSVESTQLVLSIIAGARIETLTKGLGHSRVVRAMPNTPAQIGAGVSAWTASGAVTEEPKKWAQDILRAMGEEIYFDEEKYLDMATAVSGSGPAYFFLLAEALVEAAVQISLPRQAAEQLVLPTMLGSARLLKRSGKSPAELRQQVTSPGGTTARAIQVFEEGGFSGLVKEAVRAAYNRAKELGT